MRISDVAHAAGCTVRAVRHYHAIGALPEPKRLSNGYRDYSIHDLAALIRLTTLTGAGVPLANVHNPEAVEKAIEQIDTQIEDLRRKRVRLVRIQKEGLGIPKDVEDALSKVIGDSGYLRMELDSLQTMAVAGVATPATWKVIRANLAEESVCDATRRARDLWNELGEMPNTVASRSTVQAFAVAVAAGYGKGIIGTLVEGELPLVIGDVPVRGAQALALTEMVAAAENNAEQDYAP